MTRTHDEHPDAGDEWLAKALLLGAKVEPDVSVWSKIMWRASAPGYGMYFGMTPARASRKLVRAITGVD